tara:strand:+ start:2415 stop:2711 length:297 start_codon:yes stop_codon:yes gene_type:complete
MKKAIFNLYVDYICSQTDIKRRELFRKDKHPRISTARFLLYTICKQRPMTVAQIIELMSDEGYKTSRSSVEYGIEKISNSNDIDINNVIKNITEECTI